MRFPTLPRIAYDYLVKHWIVCAFGLTVPAYWFAVLRLTGKSWGLLTTAGDMTSLAHCITWPLLVVSVGFALMKTAADKYNEEAKSSGQYVLEHLLQGVNAVTSAKLRRFGQYIEAGGHPNAHAFPQITQPRQQIETLLQNLQITFSNIFGISRDDIGLSIVYDLRNSGNWEWLISVNATDDLDLSALMANPETTVRQLVDNNLRTLFFPDKRLGAAQHRYFPGPKDRPYDGIGSVLCRDVSIVHGAASARAVLTVTTYGKQLCEADDADSIRIIETVILPAFQTRIRLEMSLLYIKEVLNPACARCPG